MMQNCGILPRFCSCEMAVSETTIPLLGEHKDKPSFEKAIRESFKKYIRN